ncbi:MAG: Glycine-tRNA ligase [Candidatus Collierbacteria bacterium GW2011_GWB2_44_22]|uniref:Glycine-tRNA ligase n=1 Tax=Candidatus Collierbacteria bacterium GW2011_GWB2_44_22 TaxID=1618387 RepID=A0A0G1HY36_9BACT|nr:MAG: Glycine-tRNA ligase [Candidatus Collierbacteria bacterium GW2011_GWB2_44_22]
MFQFALACGLSESKLRWRSHSKEELSHYSSRTEDLEYEFPWGFKEMFGLAYRTDFDLKNHIEKSGVDLRYTDPYTQEKFIPHVIEPTFGLSRLLTIILMNAYFEDTEKNRVVMKFPNRLSPYQVAVFPLLGNKDELLNKAREVANTLRSQFRVAVDERGNIGKRYFTQDEIGTPFCITVDFDSLTDSSVTVRSRDTMTQERITIEDLPRFLLEHLS